MERRGRKDACGIGKVGDTPSRGRGSQAARGGDRGKIDYLLVSTFWSHLL
jgi:hypothetical protein